MLEFQLRQKRFNASNRKKKRLYAAEAFNQPTTPPCKRWGGYIWDVGVSLRQKDNDYPYFDL